MENLWNGSVYPDTSGTGTYAGPGGGGGGGATSAAGVGGNGAVYGGGGGGGWVTNGQPGGPIIVFTYNGQAPNPIVTIGTGISIQHGVTFT